MISFFGKYDTHLAVALAVLSVAFVAAAFPVSKFWQWLWCGIIISLGSGMISDLSLDTPANWLYRNEPENHPPGAGG